MTPAAKNGIAKKPLALIGGGVIIRARRVETSLEMFKIVERRFSNTSLEASGLFSASLNSLFQLGLYY